MSYEATVSDGVARFRRVPESGDEATATATGVAPTVEWLSTGPAGGRSRAPAAYNVSVPSDWGWTDLPAYGRERVAAAGFEADGPTLLTGVVLDHARVARLDSVTVLVTAGITNPAALPVDPVGETGSAEDPAGETGSADESPSDALEAARPDRVGTVNLLVGTTRELAPGALANLLTVAAEAKAATLQAETGFTGTTTDAVIVGHDPAGERAEFSGSATAVGAATRSCVRDAVRASLRSWASAGGDDGNGTPDSVAAATYGVSTDARATVGEPDRRE